MKAPDPALDLSPLGADYEIVGELDGVADSRRYIASRKNETSKRRDDQREVLIEVVATPTGDEANALTHLAADTGLLRQQPHRRLVPVIEGRWLGNDAYAVVTQRIADPTLAQRLLTGETFTNPRIAAILREVNGLLEWARAQNVVHRSVTADRVYLEPGTDRVRVTFGVAPIRRIHHSDADDDARTIARLAMAMLTGEVDPEAYSGKKLAELRSDLPERLGEATATLLDTQRASTPADVAAYLALIGMADPLRAGETERDRIRAEVLEEQRVEREKLAAERAAFEREMSEARAQFDAEMTAARDRLEADRAAMDEAVARERAELERAAAAERSELRRALESERATLAARRAELERTVAEQRAELERVAAEDRRRIDALRAELRRAGELEIEKKRQAALEDITDEEDKLGQGELATPRFAAPMLSPLQQLEFDDDTPVMRTDEIVFPPLPVAPAAVEPVEEPVAAADRSSFSRNKWIASGVGVALAAAVAVWTIVLANQPTSARTVAAPVQRPAPSPPTPVAARPAPAPVLDSATLAASSRWLDSLRRANPVELPPIERSPAAERPLAQRPAGEGSMPAAARIPAVAGGSDGETAARRRPARDTLAPRQPRALTDSLFYIPGSATPVRPRPDTTTLPPRQQ